jgi:hypothetical protein
MFGDAAFRKFMICKSGGVAGKVWEISLFLLQFVNLQTKLATQFYNLSQRSVPNQIFSRRSRLVHDIADCVHITAIKEKNFLQHGNGRVGIMFAWYRLFFKIYIIE